MADEAQICIPKGEYERLIKIAGETIKSKNDIEPKERLGELNEIHSTRTEIESEPEAEND